MPFHSKPSWATLRPALAAGPGWGWARQGRINGAGAEFALCNGEVSVSVGYGGNYQIIKVFLLQSNQSVYSAVAHT